VSTDITKHRVRAPLTYSAMITIVYLAQDSMRHLFTMSIIIIYPGEVELSLAEGSNTR
jgi:hypothetical protein